MSDHFAQVDQILSGCIPAGHCTKKTADHSWRGFKYCSDCSVQAGRLHLQTKPGGPTPGESILLACDHAEQRMFVGMLRVCDSCARKAIPLIRKEERAAKAQAKVEAEANLYKCCRCNEKPYRYSLAGYPLCTNCSKAAKAAHQAAVAQNGAVFGLMAGGRLLGDKSEWYCIKHFGSLKAWAEEQARLNPQVTL